MTHTHTHTHSYTYHSYAHTMLYAHTHTTRTQSYSHTQGTLSPIHFAPARLRPRRPRDESKYDDDPIVLRNRGRSPDENEDTDGTEDEDTEATMSAEDESCDEASPPVVASPVFEYDSRKR